MGLTKTCHFYVVIPHEDTAISNDVSQAVSSTQELAAIMKRNPRARFQSANSPEEAMQKALEKIQFSRDTESLVSPSPRAEGRRRGRSSLSAVEGSLGAPATPSPKTDELLMMGREIITKQNDKVLERIEKNPRILCTESEFPTILQEGCKLNAMHLAAKSSNHVVMKHILNCASSMDFMRRIYPSQSEERLKSCSKHLASCYLNTPDKMFQETPLHFACKFNAVECVQLLLSHPFCDTKLKNYENKTAVELIGQRDDVNNAKARAIGKLIEQKFIVPIWRNTSVDGDAPVLGEVSCIRDLGQAIPSPLLSSKFPDFSLSLLEPCAPKLLPKASQSNHKLFTSQTAVWRIMAFAGPMDEKEAKKFRKVMKDSRFLLFGNVSPESSLNVSANNDLGECMSPPSTPPCRSPDQGQCTPPPSSQLLLSPISSPISRRSLCNSPVRNCSPLKTDIAARVRDVEKGLERIAFEYAHDMGIPWLEYWKFLGKFTDLSSEEGLEMLEDYLRSLESTKRAFVNDELENSGGEGNSTLEEVIERLTNIKLSNSGLASPEGRSGFCTNPKCRMESRFCNCDSVVPMIPYIGKHDFMDDWGYGDIDAKDVLPFSGDSQPFIGIRKLNSSANTDSFEVSANNSVDADFQWPGPCPFNDIFSTAPSSPIENDVFEDCLSGAPVYFNGNEPGKLDYQVFQVLKDCSENLDRNKHLTTFQWFNSMQAYGNALAATTQRTMANGTPKRLWGPSFVSTPGREDKSFDTSF